MRLWHKDLIDVLPQKQLCGQWRECLAIAHKIKDDGTPGHILVNRIMDYPLCHFSAYCLSILMEMESRNYKPSYDKLDLIYNICACELCKYNESSNECEIEGGADLFFNWHNDVYLRECLYNLEEKYICGGIPQEQWDKIYKKFSDKFELVKEKY